MRISDWSSDVCSSDLAYASRHDRETLLHLDGVMLALRLFPGHQPWNTRHFLPGIGHGLQAAILRMRATGLKGHHETLPRSVLHRVGHFKTALVNALEDQIGRAAGRERGGQYV